MEKSLAIANELIKRGIEHDSPPTQMKLQKLMYFAHGWHLALFDEPLVDELFQAWPYGPVIPSIYHEFKIFGTVGIDTFGSELIMLPDGKFSWVEPFIQNSAGIVTPLLDRIWKVFGKYSGGQLSEMTHANGSPWKEMHDRHGDTRNTVIPDELIKSYFKGLIPHGQRA